MPKHVVLVGIPGSGKSTVGRLAAGLLGAPFVDLDRLIEERAGRSISRIFATDGEAAFRALEAELGAEALKGPASVLAPGGGFFADRQGRQLALDSGLVVYLETSPSVASRRLEGQGERPMLKGFDRTLRLRQVLEQREAAYLEAPGRVSTDWLSPERVAAKVVELARSEGGW